MSKTFRNNSYELNKKPIPVKNWREMRDREIDLVLEPLKDNFPEPEDFDDDDIYTD